MKKLLNNRYAVIALAIGMAGFWWYQLNAIFSPGGAATSLFPSGTDAVDNDSMSPERVALVTSAVVMTPTAIVATTPSRDPFSRPVPSVVGNHSNVAAAPDSAAITDPVLPELNALLTGPATKLAVIDGRIVKPGDFVSGHQVKAIGAATVTLDKTDFATRTILQMPAARLD